MAPPPLLGRPRFGLTNNQYAVCICRWSTRRADFSRRGRPLLDTCAWIMVARVDDKGVAGVASHVMEDTRPIHRTMRASRECRAFPEATAGPCIRGEHMCRVLFLDRGLLRGIFVPAATDDEDPRWALDHPGTSRGHRPEATKPGSSASRAAMDRLRAYPIRPPPKPLAGLPRGSS